MTFLLLSAPQLMSLYVGSMLLSSKRYCTEVYPGMEVWSYEDLAYASFGVLGRVIRVGGESGWGHGGGFYCCLFFS